MSKRSSPERPSSSDRTLENALFALRMQRPHEAERLAADVLKSSRGNTLAAHILGRALVLQNRAAEAIAPLEKAARRSDDLEIEILFAGALAAVGRSDEALDRLRRTTMRRPPVPIAFLEYAGQLSKMGRLDEATAVLESGLSLVPDALDLQMELGFHRLKRNARAEARSIFMRVLAAAPQRPDVLTALAKVMALDGEYAGAADFYRRALGLRPEDAMARNNLGICLLEMGDRDGGEASLRAATRGDPRTAGQAITVLAAASHGRFFLQPSAAAKFLRIERT